MCSTGLTYIIEYNILAEARSSRSYAFNHKTRDDDARDAVQPVIERQRPSLHNPMMILSLAPGDKQSRSHIHRVHGIYLLWPHFTCSTIHEPRLADGSLTLTLSPIYVCAVCVYAYMHTYT